MALSMRVSVCYSDIKKFVSKNTDLLMQKLDLNFTAAYLPSPPRQNLL